MTTTLTERVASGAALLDLNEPGWEEAIDPETLSLVSVFDCVLGQVFGSYTEGTDVLGVSRWGEESAEYGFRLPNEEDVSVEPDEADSWADLTEAWRNLLLSRATTTHTCRYCGRGIRRDDGGTWVDPEATGDDRIWRETCESHDTITAEHEPEEVSA